MSAHFSEINNDPLASALYTVKSALHDDERIRAWHHVWRIRSFGFFGVHGTRTIYRELKREEGELEGMESQELDDANELIRAVRHPSSEMFLDRLGGVGIRTWERPVRLKVVREGDDVHEAQMGLEWLNGRVIPLTRWERWHLNLGSQTWVAICWV